ncbi:Unknown protein [Striga hermonthica]|uniref:Uncharacterized protein n=1 Tax=Striga hermonthica TaxID=68872 RepID=A0A9N7MZN0_STRHE|nr:Unknown protein [Striga hermonthica]
MKRARGSSRKEATAEDGSKKAKLAAPEAEKAAAEKKAATEAAAEWASLWSGLDEEMLWASSWIPFWETDVYDVLYGDVLWDFDIWGFKVAPNP